MEDLPVRLEWYQSQDNLFIYMELIELIKLADKQPGDISFLGFSDPSNALNVLRGMLNGTIKKRDININVEPHRDGKNFVPKANDILHEVNNRLDTTCTLDIVTESSSEYDSAVTFINSFNSINSLITKIYKKNRVGDIIIIENYNIEEAIKEEVDSFIIAENITSEFANGKYYSYIIKSKVPIKKFSPPKVQRTRSQLT